MVAIKEDEGNWNRPVKGLVLEESHFKDRLVNRFNVKGMEQLDQTKSCKAMVKASAWISARVACSG